jgi:glycine betaine/choline ABC-type transport system substrate-binding protein
MPSRQFLVLLFILISLFLSACTEEEPIPIPTALPTSTSIPTPTVEPTAEAVVEPVIDENQASDKKTLTVGSRDFTEQLLLGQILIAVLSDAGFEVTDETGLGGTNTAHEALSTGEVDIIWEYIGTILAATHGIPTSSLPTEVDEALALVAGLDKRQYDLVWLEASAFNATYTFMIKPGTVEGMETLEELADFMNENDAPLKLCVENEFYSRDDGLFPLQEHYDFAFKEENIEIVAYDQLYEGLRDGLCDVAEGFSTDGRISAWGFQNLVDSLKFFPVYNASPIVRQEVLDNYPELEELLGKLGSYLDDESMTELNARVDVGADGKRNSGDEESPRDVALDFLSQICLVGECPKLTVGSRDFTEQLLLGQILIGVLENEGFEVTDKTGLGGTNTAHDAIANGEVDVIWEYIGTILAARHGVPTTSLPTDIESALEMVSALDKHHYNLVWLEASAFNDTYTFMVKPGTIPNEIETIDDLADFMNENDAPLKLCVENEFYGRDDGLYPLQQHYDFAFKEENIEIVAYDQLYEGLRDGLCEVAEGFSTDGRISAWGFRNLADSGSFFPVYNASPIVREDVLEQYPELTELLGKVGRYLDDETITNLNARVDVGADGERNSGDEELPRDVARDFLKEAGLLGKRRKIVVGSRDFTEQLLLGQISIVLLEDAGFEVIDETGLGGTNTGYAALTNGEADLIWEYTGTALAEFHNIKASELPTDLDEAWQQVAALDEPLGLIWLAPAEFNDTYTLMVKSDKIPKEIESMDDLATYMNENDAPLSLCVENEFYSRDDGLFPLQEHYDFAFQEENIEIVAYDQLYEGLRDDLCDVAEGFSTDGRISAWGFRNLADSREFFPAYNAAPIVREVVLNKYPEIRQLFEQISIHLDDETITRLNARVDIGSDEERNSGDEESVRTVAEIFLCKIGLREEDCPELSEEVIAEGSEEESEEEAAEGTDERSPKATAERRAKATVEGTDEGTDERSAKATAERRAKASAESSRDEETEEAISCENILLNGDFEDDTDWVFTGTSTAEYTTLQSHNGEQALRLGFSEQNISAHSAANQQIVLPDNATSAALVFWYYPISQDFIGGDTQGMLIYNSNFSEVRQRVLWDISNEQAWVRESHDLSNFIGEELNMHFLVINDSDTVRTTMFLDDVSVEVCYEE